MKIYDFSGKKNISGDRIKEARKNMKLSQEEVAARLQVMGVYIERDSVSRIEIGTHFVTDYEIMALCNILKLSPFLFVQNWRELTKTPMFANKS